MSLITLFKSHANPPTLITFILILRLILILAAAINLCALLASFQLYNVSTTAINFQETAQLAVNTFLFIAGIYSFLGAGQWSRRVRATSGLILLGCNAALIGTVFRAMNQAGGCANGTIFNLPLSRGAAGSADEFISPLKRRCQIQMVVGIVGIVWGVVLLVELITANIQRSRELEEKLRLHRIAHRDQLRQQQLAATVHIYQPDLSLTGDQAIARGEREEGGETIQGATSTLGAGGREMRIDDDGEDAVELEQLPAYEQRPAGPRPQIVDMTDMGHLSTPMAISGEDPRTSRTNLHLEDGQVAPVTAAAPIIPAPTVFSSENILTPPPHYQGPSY